MLVSQSEKNNGSSGGSTNPPFTTISTTVTSSATATSSTTTTRSTTSTSVATAAAPAGTFAILPPPVVTCVYGGSATCGCSATQPLFAAPRVVQGYTARANSWPWIVSLTYTTGDEGSFCGGTLITYRHVLTAAHCFFDPTTAPDDLVIRADVQTLSNGNEGQTIAVATITIHPNYVPENDVYDIAILTLTTPVAQTPTVGLCCLSFDTTLPAVGERAVIIGWGDTTDGGQSSNVLLQAVVQVQAPSATCAIPSTDIEFCAGFSGTDTCQGDSGGPFMTSVNNAWTCTGVVSRGVFCGTPDVYTRVSAYQEFINNIINA